MTDQNRVTRRSFLQRTTLTAAGGTLLATFPTARFAHAAASDTLKVALVGCGGRGSGAAEQALSTEGPVKLVAMADVHPDNMERSLKNLQAKHSDKIEVPKERQFTGFDGYKKAISQADVVILATPPGFRPPHFEEAVRQGKHIFAEKPVCVDAPGFRKVMAAAQEAKRKNLKVGIGLQRHHNPSYLELVQRIHDGLIGDVVSMRAFWVTNPPWTLKREELERNYGRRLTEMEYQVRNWYHFLWLCGDHIVEQHVHNLDIINWVKNGHPVKARGMGGREPGKERDYGEIFDHHAVEFIYADGSVCQSMSRQQLGCWNEVSEYVIGTKGHSWLHRGFIAGPNAWRYKGTPKNPYQQEHDDLFDAIRNDKPYNEAEYGAISTFTAVFGRMATYSGREIEWDEAVNSNVDTMPKGLDTVPYEEAVKIAPVSKPGPDGSYPLPMPGQSTVI